MQLQGSVDVTGTLQAPDVFAEGPAGLSFGRPEIHYGADRRSAELHSPVGVAGAQHRPQPGWVLRQVLEEEGVALGQPLDLGGLVGDDPDAAGLHLESLLGPALAHGFSNAAFVAILMWKYT